MTSPEEPGTWSDPTAPTPPSGPATPEPPTVRVPSPPPAVPSPPSTPPAVPSPPPAVALPASTSTTEPYPTYAAPPPYPPQAGQPYPGQQYAYGPVAPPTNGLAIASMIVALVVCGPAGAIMGHIARNQIRERGEQGDGFALAGIIIGWVTTGIGLLVCCGFALFSGLLGGASVFSNGG
jgi:hypothetical protein